VRVPSRAARSGDALPQDCARSGDALYEDCEVRLNEDGEDPNANREARVEDALFEDVQVGVGELELPCRGWSCGGQRCCGLAALAAKLDVSTDVARRLGVAVDPSAEASEGRRLLEAMARLNICCITSPYDCEALPCLAAPRNRIGGAPACSPVIMVWTLQSSCDQNSKAPLPIPSLC